MFTNNCLNNIQQNIKTSEQNVKIQKSKKYLITRHYLKILSEFQASRDKFVIYDPCVVRSYYYTFQLTNVTTESWQHFTTI